MRYVMGALALALGSMAQAAELMPWQQSAIELTKAETQVVDATWSQDISLWVTMADKGTSRDGFAGYLCLVLDDAGRPNGEFVSITIWDAKTASTQTPRQIGKATCS